jgi:hypothetical protein
VVHAAATRGPVVLVDESVFAGRLATDDQAVAAALNRL